MKCIEEIDLEKDKKFVPWLSWMIFPFNQEGLATIRYEIFCKFWKEVEIFSQSQFCFQTTRMNTKWYYLMPHSNRSGTGTSHRNGTCLTESECSEDEGFNGGDCAGGFGVCCVFMISTCGGSITQNSSYIKNPNFPAASTTTNTCSFTINKCDPGTVQPVWNVQICNFHFCR